MSVLNCIVPWCTCQAGTEFVDFCIVFGWHRWQLYRPRDIRLPLNLSPGWEWLRQGEWLSNTHTHAPVECPLSRTTRVSRHQKGKTNLDFTEARDSEWQWHQLGHMQVCTSLQTDNHATPHNSVFYRPDALPAAQPTASKHWRQITHSRQSHKMAGFQLPTCLAALFPLAFSLSHQEHGILFLVPPHSGCPW